MEQAISHNRDGNFSVDLFQNVTRDPQPNLKAVNKTQDGWPARITWQRKGLL